MSVLLALQGGGPPPDTTRPRWRDNLRSKPLVRLRVVVTPRLGHAMEPPRGRPVPRLRKAGVVRVPVRLTPSRLGHSMEPPLGRAVPRPIKSGVQRVAVRQRPSRLTTFQPPATGFKPIPRVVKPQVKQKSPGRGTIIWRLDTTTPPAPPPPTWPGRYVLKVPVLVRDGKRGYTRMWLLIPGYPDFVAPPAGPGGGSTYMAIQTKRGVR
jgi:hypothetical protein